MVDLSTLAVFSDAFLAGDHFKREERSSSNLDENRGIKRRGEEEREQDGGHPDRLPCAAA